MKQRKKTYDVKVERYGDRQGIPFKEHYKTIRTYANSKAKAESNAKYRNEGNACWCQEYGTEGNWYSYDYNATEVTDNDSQTLSI